MPAFEPGKIRNVAVVGHRGTGKTSLVEALLFQAGETNRLGTIEAGSTVADWDDDEQQRRMSISLSLTHAEWQGRKLNLIDVPGDPSFQGEARCSLRVVEGGLFVLSGVMGVEVGTGRVWKRAEELGLARVLFINMLDRERADFFRALAQLQEQLSPRCVAVQLPIGAEHELTGIVDVLHMCSYTSPEGEKEPEPGPIPDELAAQVQEYREKLLDEVVQTDESLMERYLDGQELGVEEVAHALKDAVTRGEVFPVACGVATKNLGSHALLDLIVEGVPSPRRPVRSPTSRAPIRLPSSSRRLPTRSPGGSTSSAFSKARSSPIRRSSTRAPTRRSAWARSSSSRARSTSPRRSSAPATSARSRS